MELYFVRHGEAEHNVKRVISQDPKILSHLTENGKKQARETGKKLRKVLFDVVFISEFVRTKETADIINENRKLKIVVDKRINESRVGFEGRSLKEYVSASTNDFFNFKVRGCESWNDVKKRVKEFLESLKKKNYEKILVVTHEWIVRIVHELINELTNEETKKLIVGNCEIFFFEV